MRSWLDVFRKWYPVNILKHQINILRIFTNVIQLDDSRMRYRSQIFDFLDQIIRSMSWLHNFLFAVTFDRDTTNCLFFLSQSNLCIWSLTKKCWRQNILVVKGFQGDVTWEEIIDCFELSLRWMFRWDVNIVSSFRCPLKLRCNYSTRVLSLASLIWIIFFFPWCVVRDFDVVWYFDHKVLSLRLFNNLLCYVSSILTLCLNRCWFWSYLLRINRVV